MEWISVKDKLPIEDQWCLYYFEHTGISIGQYNKSKETKEVPVEFDCFHGSDGWLCGDVTHWMPLPEHPTIEGA